MPVHGASEYVAADSGEREARPDLTEFIEARKDEPGQTAPVWGDTGNSSGQAGYAGASDASSDVWERVSTVTTERSFVTAASAGTVHVQQARAAQLPTVMEVPAEVRETVRAVIGGALSPQALKMGP